MNIRFESGKLNIDLTDEEIESGLTVNDLSKDILKSFSEYGEIEAERNSFFNENKNLKNKLETIEEELKKTKEANYTLTRQLSVENTESAEDILNKMF